MKWFDAFLKLTSILAVVVTGLDAALGELRLITVVLGLLVLAALLSFYILTSQSLSPQKSYLLWGNRFVLAVSCLGIIVALYVYRATPSLTISVDNISRFELIDGYKKVIYSHAGHYNDTLVFGRGQIIFLTLKNNSRLPIDIVSIRLRLLRRTDNVPPVLKYDKLTLSLPHTRLPIEEIDAPFRWTSMDKQNTTKDIGEGRLRLTEKGTDTDTHQMKFVVEARSAGLWQYMLEINYIEPKTGDKVLLSHPAPLMILKRGD